MKAADLTVLDVYKRIPLLRTNINENNAVESSLSVASALKKTTLVSVITYLFKYCIYIIYNFNFFSYYLET